MTNVNKINGRDYTERQLDNGKYTIVCRKTGKKLVEAGSKGVEGYDHIYGFGFLKGESNYCVVRQNNKEAILDVPNNKIITNWYDYISRDGFVVNQSQYCIVGQNFKFAILDVPNNKIITGWYCSMFGDDFFTGKLEYLTFELLNHKLVNFNPLNKVYKNSIIDKFIMTIKFKESLWEYWYRCF